jgi:hypothetical protein
MNMTRRICFRFAAGSAAAAMPEYLQCLEIVTVLFIRLTALATWLVDQMGDGGAMGPWAFILNGWTRNHFADPPVTGNLCATLLELAEEGGPRWSSAPVSCSYYGTTPVDIVSGCGAVSHTFIRTQNMSIRMIEGCSL